MKRVEVKLAVPIVAPLLDVIREQAPGLREVSAGVTGLPDADDELREAWADELLAGQRGEVDALLALFGEEFFREGVVAFDGDNAEVILRACAAVRLRLREHALKTVGDEALETGELEISRLPRETNLAFRCYVFLATLQEVIIQHLDESILGG
ncbi:MAG: hypothetical protein RIR76_1139 [Verrucomicrobiota bacterium]|jgi:hypothetical protein|nr:hypothetical protein [Opitutaceae bacterium]